MVKKDEFCMMKAEIDQRYKDQFLVELSNLNVVHIKPKTNQKIKKQLEEKDPIRERTKDLRKNLNSLFKRLDITEHDILELKPDKQKRFEFVAKDLHELINRLFEEIDFFTNRAIELTSYISKGVIELENLHILKNCYKHLENIILNKETVDSLSQFNFRVFTTFSKNLPNLKNLFEYSSFPNLYNIFEIPDDRVGFYVFYPKDKHEEFNGRIRLIHSEEVPVLKKYLTLEGINFSRIDNEIQFIEDLISRYRKEQNRIIQDNLVKFGAINEVVQNIEEYTWVDQQFERTSSNRLLLKFFVPSSKREEIKQDLFKTFKKDILIESIDVSKSHPMHESDILTTKKIKRRKMTAELEELNIEESEITVEDEENEDLRDAAPTIMKNFFLAKPFETLTKMYGTPTYSEIDPTPFIAVTFPILFGLMFGDIGHGLILILSGLIGAFVLRKRGKNVVNLCWIIFFCGWASFFVGFLYGEFFGNNEIEIFGTIYYRLKPITIPFLNITLYDPLENIPSILYFVIIIGVFHINLGWFIQFLNYWRQHRKYLAFSDSFIKILLITGGTILIFGYGFDIYTWLAFPYPILLVVIPGILLFILKPLGKLFKISYLQKESFGGLIGEGSIEAFDTFLSIMSNVASYIRLLALGLAHFALLYSINAMSSLIKGEGLGFDILSFIGLTFGNIIVILLEGLLVFLNTMRLHFYEFFFKFYQGSGIDYFPFYLDNDYSIMKFRGETGKDIISEEIEKEFDTKLVKEEIDKAKKYILKKFR